MYLKRLELCGFKSFADKTRLDFEPGISAILGPNGCGKSNISDAIRWCLGEQSARSMRSKQMLDVIFSGSQSRPTTGMAEVTLTFDNANNVLPLDYAEVSITRRLFRSGESEYFINRIQCRLKDIRDLFLDTGIGSEGYSIIEQGKVEFLLLASAEERREMFEEAAGVSKYKVRREETLRKLEKVDVDMNRVNDMLALLKDQITALDQAARKARQFQKHREDLRRLEITALVHAIARDLAEVERIKGEMAPREREFETQNTALDRTDAELAELRVRQVQKDDEYVKLQDEYAQVRSGIDLADERIAQANLREQELVQRRETIGVETASGEQRIGQLERELESVVGMARDLAAETQRLEQEYRARESDVTVLRETISGLSAKENALKESLLALAARQSGLRNDKVRLQSQQSYCQAQAASLERDLARQQEHVEPVNQEIAAKQAEHAAAVENLNGLRARTAQARERLAAAETARAEHRARRAELSDRLIGLQSRAQTIREWDSSDPLRSTMRVVLGADIPGIRGAVSSLIRIDPGMEQVVAAALGDALNYLVADTVDAALNAVRLLEERGAGRLTFIVLERLPESPHSAPLSLPPTARALISLLQYPSEFAPLMHALCQNTMIDGTQIFGQALIQGGGPITADRPVLIEEQLRSLDAEIRGTQSAIEAAGRDSAALDESLRTIQEELRALELEAQRVEVHAGWMEKQLAAKREELELLHKGSDLNRADIAAQRAEEEKIVAQAQEIDRTLAVLAAEETGGSAALGALAAELQDWRGKEAGAASLLTEAKVAWASRASDLTARQREEQKLQESIAETRRMLDQYRQELSGIDTRMIELATIRETETARLRELHAVQGEKERLVQASLAERQQLSDELERRSADIADLRKAVDELQQEIHNRQMDLRSFELRLQSAHQRIQDEHAASFDEVKAEYLPLSVNEEEIARLKRRIESMGAVNLTAPEEYTALEERYNFLLTQQQDLLKAKEDLLQVITKINQTTREHFRQTFDKVRENFRVLYHQLFEGGEADLVLTDESNLLETGIEILAQPPGKRLQNITLLSGGEKALTAIALLFAFFMVRPSPFCILDEVDAPLDDANIGRYINMIRSFAERSQFLVVTHNKRTMEMADVLFGVTMEELGVSKIISVKLNKQNELAAV